MTTISRLYDDNAHARAVVEELGRYGVADADISLVSGHDPYVEISGAATGAAVGAAVGGSAGLLAGLGLMAIPGVGPVVAVGWLASTLAGAAAGATSLGIVGALPDTGVSADDAEVYAEGLRRGGSLVSVRVTNGNHSEIEHILDDRTPVVVADRRAQYASGGWNGFDQNAPSYTPKTPHPRQDATRP